MRYARLRAASPTYGAVTRIVLAAPGDAPCYVLGLDTAISGPRLIRAWKRRHWIAHCLRTLQPLLATGAWQGHSEDASDGHLVLRLMGCFGVFYTSRVLCKGRLTMAESIFSLKHYWRFVNCEALELTALSHEAGEKAACIKAACIDRKSHPFAGSCQEARPLPYPTFDVFSLGFSEAHSTPDWPSQTHPCFHARGVGFDAPHQSPIRIKAA